MSGKLISLRPRMLVRRRLQLSRSLRYNSRRSLSSGGRQGSAYGGRKQRIREKSMSTTMSAIVDVGISKQIGKYSDAVEVPRNARWLFISGTPGLTSEGTLPQTFEGQAEQAWKNVLEILKQAGMASEHLVKIVQ